MPSINLFIYKKSAFWLFLFFGFAVFAFWKTYYSNPDHDILFYQHFHGICMTIWCLLLIGQAFLIRFQKYQIHSLVGKSSFIVFPMLIISTFLLIHFSLGSSGEISTRTLNSMALMFNATLVLIIFYGLGMYFRKDRLTHARYMVCTIFPMFTPVTDRIIYNHIKPLIRLAPKIEGMPIVPFYGFMLADLIVLGLIFADWKSNKKFGVFSIVLALLLLFHISVFTFYKFSFWQSFTAWFLGLPLT